MSKISSKTLQQQFKTTNYIGLAMMAAVFLYALIVIGIDKGYIPYKAQPEININTAGTLKYILLGVALLHYFIIRFIQKFSLKSAAYLPAATVLIFVLCEVVSIYGLALFLLTGNLMDFYIFMLISLLYFYIFYPKYAVWEKLFYQEYSTNLTT